MGKKKKSFWEKKRKNLRENVKRALEFWDKYGEKIMSLYMTGLTLIVLFLIFLIVAPVVVPITNTIDAAISGDSDARISMIWGAVMVILFYTLTGRGRRRGFF